MFKLIEPEVKIIIIILKSIKKACIIGFFFVGNIFAQNSQLSIENLKEKYSSKSFNKSEELTLIKEILLKSNDPKQILKYADILIERAIELDSAQYLFNANLQKGNAYLMKSDFSKSLEGYLTAADIATETNSKVDKAIIKITIGGLYSEMGNHDNSIEYYENSINELRDLINSSSDSLQNSLNEKITTEKLESYLATALLNSGDEYFNAGKYEKALGNFYESSSISEKLNKKLYSAYNLGNIGMVYAKQNKPKLAEANMNAAIKILEKEQDYYPIPVYLSYISDIYIDLDLPEIAKGYTTKSLKLAKKYQLKEEISNANKKLSDIYEASNNIDSSLYHLKQYVKYQDSLSKSLSESTKMASQFEISKKQDELDLLKEKQQIEMDLLTQKQKNERIITYSFLGGLVLVSGLAIGLYRRNKFISKTKKIIDDEKKKSDSLLLNILPRETADELKSSGKVEAKKYESVTVLFTDFKGFTRLAENSTPEKLVESVDMYFSEFDKIMAKYKLEKIKTIGDAYMCAGGLPEQSDNHADLMAKAALEISEFVKNSKQVHAVSDLRFDIRIGIHTGPVVAGVVGKYKFTYDIWGDTVNVASRIESSCEPGKISVSEDTYKLIKDKYAFEERGEIPMKNRSPINMYYLSRK